MSSTRSQVLSLFKKLHRTRQRVFRGDENVLTATRQRLNNDFKDKKHVEDKNSIAALIKYGEEIEAVLCTEVVQAKVILNDNSAGKTTVFTYGMLEKNTPYNEYAVIDEPRPPNQRCKK